MAKKKLKVSIFELIWYILTGLLGAWGLTFITLGIIVRNLKPYSDLALADNSWKEAMKTNYFTSGIIILVTAVVAAVIVLCIFAKTADREVEKQQRRAARLAAASAAESAPEEPKPTEE